MKIYDDIWKIFNFETGKRTAIWNKNTRLSNLFVSQAVSRSAKHIRQEMLSICFIYNLDMELEFRVQWYPYCLQMFIIEVHLGFICNSRVPQVLVALTYYFFGSFRDRNIKKFSHLMKKLPCKSNQNCYVQEKSQLHPRNAAKCISNKSFV